MLRLQALRTPLRAVRNPGRALSHCRPSLRKLTEYKYDEAELMRSKLDSEPYYAKRESQPHDDDEPKKNSSPAELQRFQTIEAVKGLLTGLLTIAGLVGGYTLYTEYPKLQAWWSNDGSIDFELPQKRKRVELPVITSTLTSDTPGLYLCGDNTEGVVSLDKKVGDVRFPLRHPWFDHKLLKEVVLGASSGVAVDSKGDLIQWGHGYNDEEEPEYTVKGQGLRDVRLSNGIVYALNKKNELLMIPVKKGDGPGNASKGWFGSSVQAFGKMDLSPLPKGEKIQSFDTGKEHLVVLTNRGRTFTCSTGYTTPLKSFGQFGIPQFSHLHKPPPANVLHEISLLNNHITKKNNVDAREITKVVCGNFHTLALDSMGELYSFGQNTYGQLGHAVDYTNENISIPRQVAIFNKHVKKGIFPEVINVFTGGDTSFVEIHPVKMYKLIRGKQTDDNNVDEAEVFTLGFGKNLKGQIGNGLFIHAQADPVRIRELDRYTDFNEDLQISQRIGVSHWSSGGEHTLVKLNNGDVLYWGANDFGQLGNGKRNRIPKPQPMPKLLEPGVTEEDMKRIGFVNRLQLREGMDIVAGERASGVFYTK